jgi:hypothetical protein
MVKIEHIYEALSRDEEIGIEPVNVIEALTSGVHHVWEL